MISSNPAAFALGRRPLGRLVYAASAVALGLVGVLWGDFANFWQPVPPEFPFRTLAAYSAALIYLVLGLALAVDRTIKPAAIGLAILHFLFSLLWVRRIIGFPNLVGTWSGFAEEFVLVLAAIALFYRLDGSGGNMHIQRGLQMVFGLCLISFGLAHFTALNETAAVVPDWIPPNKTFWAIATGVAHVAAGVSLLIDVYAVLASLLLTLMFLGFSLLVWAPRMFESPHDHVTWAGNAINLALLASAWVMADSIRSRVNQRPVPVNIGR